MTVNRLKTWLANREARRTWRKTVEAPFTWSIEQSCLLPEGGVDHQEALPRTRGLEAIVRGWMLSRRSSLSRPVSDRRGVARTCFASLPFALQELPLPLAPPTVAAEIAVGADHAMAGITIAVRLAAQAPSTARAADGLPTASATGAVLAGGHPQPGVGLLVDPTGGTGSLSIGARNDSDGRGKANGPSPSAPVMGRKANGLSTSAPETRRKSLEPSPSAPETRRKSLEPSPSAPEVRRKAGTSSPSDPQAARKPNSPSTSRAPATQVLSSRDLRCRHRFRSAAGARAGGIQAGAAIASRGGREVRVPEDRRSSRSGKRRPPGGSGYGGWRKPSDIRPSPSPSRSHFPGTPRERRSRTRPSAWTSSPSRC